MLNQEKYIRYAAEFAAANSCKRSGLIPEEDMQVIFQKMKNWLDCKPEG